MAVPVKHLAAVVRYRAASRPVHAAAATSKPCRLALAVVLEAMMVEAVSAHAMVVVGSAKGMLAVAW